MAVKKSKTNHRREREGTQKGKVIRQGRRLGKLLEKAKPSAGRDKISQKTSYRGAIKENTRSKLKRRETVVEINKAILQQILKQQSTRTSDNCRWGNNRRGLQ